MRSNSRVGNRPKQLKIPRSARRMRMRFNVATRSVATDRKSVIYIFFPFMREILCVATERSLKCHDFLSGSELSRVDEVLTTCENGLFTLGGRGHLRGNVLGCIDPRKPLLRLYRLEKFKAAIRRLPLPEMGTCADSSSDGILLAVGTASGNLHIWDLTSGRFLRSMNVFPERINQVSFVDQLLVVSRGHTVNIYTISE